MGTRQAEHGTNDPGVSRAHRGGGRAEVHRNHAQLGYALKDKEPPDFAAAEAELTEAIKLRNDDGDRGFLLYEFNRALARIGAFGPNPDPEVRAAIDADLKAADSK